MIHYLIGSLDRFVGIVAYFPEFLEKLFFVAGDVLSFVAVVVVVDDGALFDVCVTPFRLKLNSGIR